MKPPQYWRQSKTWSEWLGKTGRVIASTIVRVAAHQRASQTPYSYVVVDFGDIRKEMMGEGHQVLQPGDQVECVLRKIAESEPHELIHYGLKVKKVGS